MGNAGAAAHRDGHVRGSECRSVIDAIAAEENERPILDALRLLPALANLLDAIALALRTCAGFDAFVRDAHLLRNSFCCHLIVTSDNPQVRVVLLLELIEDALCFRSNGVRDRESGGEPSSTRLWLNCSEDSDASIGQPRARKIS